MNRTYRSLIVGMVALVLMLLGIRVFLSPPWSRAVSGDGWQARMPMPALSPRTVVEGPWRMVETVGAARFRIGAMPSPGEMPLDQVAQELHCSPVERIPIRPLRGWFLLSGAQKSWRATLIFPLRDRVFRVEAWEDRGNAAEPLWAVASMAASLEAGPEGSLTVPLDQEDLEAIVRPAISRHLVGMDAIFPWMIPLVLLIFAVVLVAVRVSGRIPDRPPGSPPVILSEAQVSLEIRKGRFGRRQTVGALVLDSEGLHLYTMGRRFMTVPSRELASVRRVPGTRPGRPFEVVQESMRVRFHPGSPEAWERALARG